MKSVIVVLAIAAMHFVRAATAAPVQECQARVLQALTDDLGTHWQAGKVLPVTVERDGAAGGFYCASGGSCLPRKVHGVAALKLLNCRVGPVIGGGDRRLVPDTRLVGNAAAQTMRSRNDVEQRLSHMGFSNAAAGSLADDYVSHPRSTNGRLVARALAGSSAAIATLKRIDP